jgi:hypothetical protein
LALDDFVLRLYRVKIFRNAITYEFQRISSLKYEVIAGADPNCGQWGKSPIQKFSIFIIYAEELM